MARSPDPERKPALLQQILDYLLDKPLSTMSFRTLATGIGVSTYTLVYHFGTRAELMRDIVEAISSRSNHIQERLDTNPSLDVYIEGLLLSWHWAVQPRNRQLQRLEFEAGVLEALDPAEYSGPRDLFQRWTGMGSRALRHLGLSQEHAEVEARVIVAVFHGLQYDLVLNNDVEAATKTFQHAVSVHRRQIEALLPSLP